MLWWIVIVAVVSCPAMSREQEPPTAEQIMKAVASNQDRGVRQRAQYIYQQQIRIVSRKTNGKLMRDETADYLVTPTPDGTKKELKWIVGRARNRGRYVVFNKRPVPDADNMDGDLVNDLRDDLANDHSKNGLGRDLFPLTTDEQKGYAFKLEGEQTVNGRRVYRIQFAPRDKHIWKDDSPPWAGEALIDGQALQPLRVYTKLAHRLPLFVHTVLGTSLPGIGFDVEFRRFDKGVWFPVSFGTEFRLRVLFFIKRDITISLQNSGFERTHVKSKVLNYKPVG